MNRWSASVKSVLMVAVVALMALAAPRAAMAQEDILKMSSSAPVLIVNQIKADKTTDFEEAWAAIRALIARSDNPDLKAFGDSLANLYRVDQAPFDVAGGGKAVLYIFNLPAPSTVYSYNPRQILYDALKPGAEGSKVTRADVDPIYEKLTSAYLVINPPWVLIKAK